ncbi:MAG: FmdB family zinc ribbon protein [Nitrospirota bacterium]
MPIYEYECKECGKRFDALQKFSDEPLKECKFCGGAVRKLMGTPALQFKGTGWYVTDYAGKTPKPTGNAKEGGTEKGGESAKKEKSDSPAKESAAGQPETADRPASGGESCPSTPSGNK